MSLTSQQADQLVKVWDLSFDQLFGTRAVPEGVDVTLALAVDTYQRGFVWDNAMLLQMAEDLVNFQAEEAKLKKEGKDLPDYYMGTILIHRDADKSRRYLIDGQQRITALCILHHLLKKELPELCQLTYTPESARRIHEAASALRARQELLPGEEIFQRIVFTVITVEQVDLAFTFFDTQNNRGVRLNATDLLKAYHLREVDPEKVSKNDKLQQICASRWEAIQQGGPQEFHNGNQQASKRDFAPRLFTLYLWRARFWTAKRVQYGDHDELLEEFQKGAFPHEGAHDSVPLYASRQNRWGTTLALAEDGQKKVRGEHLLHRPEPADLPLTLRQPIHRGIGFFLYADKYADLLRRLLDGPATPELGHFRDVYQRLVKACSGYLQDNFLLASLVYYDQFQDERLWEFAMWLEHALGAIRFQNSRVVYESAQNFFKHDALNLLDVISHSHRPEQAIHHLKLHHRAQKTYAEAEIGEDGDRRVVPTYSRAVRDYYAPGATSLADKARWIQDKLDSNRS